MPVVVEAVGEERHQAVWEGAVRVVQRQQEAQDRLTRAGVVVEVLAQVH
jgi:hypothetical protein